ncbi:MAG: LysR family transcriptional regulator [Amphritea sp.]|nr:LysR family transcriptional regulator [Amphritea sp.]
MDLIRAIEVFQTVVRHSSFSAAARELNLVNSAVSRYVTDLEKRLNCRLLNRTTRSMSLTAEGRYYLEQLDRILASVEQLDADVEQREQQISGHISLTAPLHADQMLDLQGRLGRFLSAYPDVSLNWLSVNRYVNLVEEGIDLAVRVGDLADSSMMARKIGDMQVRFVASPDYLERYGVPEQPADLHQHRCIIDSANRQPARWVYKQNGSVRHISVPTSLQANNGEIVARFAADGLGIASLPDFLVDSFIREGRLVAVLEDFRRDPVPVALVWPGSRMLSPALRMLIDVMCEGQVQDNLPDPDS